MRMCRILLSPVLGLLAILLVGCSSNSSSINTSSQSLIISPSSVNVVSGEQLIMAATYQNVTYTSIKC